MTSPKIRKISEIENLNPFYFFNPIYQLSYTIDCLHFDLVPTLPKLKALKGISQ
jgi:hypothetical protein